jgi:hypothetical protein
MNIEKTYIKNGSDWRHSEFLIGEVVAKLKVLSIFGFF